jgi:ATP-dependent exoDNAse (exonuclease V) alpha subunit
MASYHLSAQPVKRSEGRSVVAMAAYRAGERLKDDRQGVVADYSRRRGVVHAEIMAPEGAAAWLSDREILWNRVEAMEVRRDAQLAREINMALPHELDDAQRLALVRSFVAKQFVSHGMVADFAIHSPVVEKGDDPRNYHVHVLLTLRQAGAGGLHSVKTREWNSEKMLAGWRAAWADAQNDALQARGMVARVDHRSFAARKADVLARGDTLRAKVFDRVPELHVGPKARKAFIHSVPESKEWQVGRAGRKRVVRYREFDKGSRSQHTIARLSANAGRFEALAKKTLVRSERFRKRLIYYEKQVRKFRPTQRKTPDLIADVLALLQDSRRKYEHALRRREQVAWWLRELEEFFLELLGLRESQLLRRTVWSNRLAIWRSRADAPDRSGRSRSLI